DADHFLRRRRLLVRRRLRSSLRRHRRGPRRTERRLPPGQGGQEGHRLRGRGPGRRHREDRRGPRGLPLRPRRAPLLHEEQGGQRPLARDHGRRVPHAPAHVAHLLARQVPRLPAQRDGRGPQARPVGADPLRPVVPARLPQAQGRRGEPRAVGDQPLRLAPVLALLQGLHREGVGRLHHRAARGVGRPADQGPVVLVGRQGRLLRQQGRDQVAHRQVPVPPLRPGPDVGDDDRAHRGARRRGAPRDPGHEDRDGRRARRRGPRGRRAHRAGVHDLLPAAARHRRHRGARAAEGGHRGRPGPALPRLPDRLARARRQGPLPGQLDLHPRGRRRGRADPELPLLVAVDGPRPRRGLRRHGVLLLQGRPPLEHGRRGPRRPGLRGAREARAGPQGAGAPRVRRPRPARLPHVRRDVRRARRLHPLVAGPPPGLPAGRPQRAAPLQQLRPLHALRDARGGQRAPRHGARHLVGERRVRLPRDADRRGQREPLREGAGHGLRARAGPQL
ncbi:MAG: Adrenodoxin reductase, partial [uncultured Solirubrobacteraceae bacterium]